MKALNEKKLQESVEKLKSMIEEGNAKIDDQQINEAVIVIGRTGHGKSSLINYLAGAKLKAVAKGFPPELYIEAIEQAGDVKIVHGGVSGTTVPNKFFDEKTGITYFDCPGFEDTRGAEQDIANAFYVKKVFDVAQKVKVLVVFKEGDFTDRLNTFLDLTKQLAQLFPETQKLAQNLALVISKSNQNSTVDAFKQFLTKAIEEQALNLSEKQKLLWSSLASNEGKVAFFTMPKETGEIDPAGAQKIVQVIQEVPYMNDIEVNLTLSAESKAVVLEWCEQVCNTIVGQLKEISSLLRNFYNDALNNGVSTEILSSNITEARKQLEGIIDQPSNASILATKLLMTHNLPYEERVKIIKDQLGYIEFINQLELKYKYHAISEGFYHVLDAVSSSAAQISLKIQSDLINKVDATKAEKEAAIQQANNLLNATESLRSSLQALEEASKRQNQQIDNLLEENRKKCQQTEAIHHHYDEHGRLIFSGTKDQWKKHQKKKVLQYIYAKR